MKQQHPAPMYGAKREPRVPAESRLSRDLRPPEPPREGPPVPYPGTDLDTACNSPPVLCAATYSQWENWDTWASQLQAPAYSYSEPTRMAKLRPSGLEAPVNRDMVNLPAIPAGAMHNVHASRSPRKH